VDMRGRLLIAWFGPRGLSSLLLVLLPVFAGLPGSEQLFSICSLVVLVSIVLHGGSPMLLARAARRRALKQNTEAAGDEVSRPLGPGPATPEADAETAENRQQAKSIVRSDDQAASCQVSADADRIQVGSQRITIEELRRLWQANEPVTTLDVRTERSLEGESFQAKGAVRMPPDHVADRARELGLKQEAWLIAYCT
jgi:NhaP-type Na+/H+ and K+/H+ antiporter